MSFTKQSRKRPGPPCAPPVWAEMRQELAESLPYYRAYQQGSYVVGPYQVAPDLAVKGKGALAARSLEKDVTPYAYLLGGFGSPRDQWADGGRVVISHGGGHAAAAEPAKKKAKADVGVDIDIADDANELATTGLSLASSQSRHDPRIAALLSSWKHGVPIVLIMGENYPLADFELNCGFAVLGWYRITHCWAEKEGDGDAEGLVRWKMRFEWEASQGRPWWHHDEAGDAAGRVWNPRVRREVCEGLVVPSARSSTTAEAAAVAAASEQSPCARPKRRSKIVRDLRKRLSKRKPGQLVTVKHGPVNQETSFTAPSSDIISSVCPHCHESSPQVYEAGWVCLVPECDKGFWRFSAGAIDNANAFNVVDAFLRASEASAGKPGMLPFPLEPQDEDEGAAGYEDGLKGHFCKQCHRLSCREYLAFHRCAHCGHTTQLPQASDGSNDGASSSSTRIPPALPSTEEALLHDTVVNAKFDIKVTRRIIAGTSGARFEVLTYEFPPVFLDSKVHLVQPCADPAWAGHASSSDGGNEKADFGEPNRDLESDAILDLLQRSSSFITSPSSAPTPSSSTVPALPPLPLRRHELTMHRSTAGSQGHKARLLTQMFTANVGEAYKHSTATETMPWEEAPPGVREAKELLERRTGWCVMTGEEEGTETKPEFNEVYPCYYAEGMRMNYHDDGEPGLGPLVSSLSLGPTSAIMNFRLKRKFLEQPPPPPLLPLQSSSSEERAPTIRRAYHDVQRRALFSWAAMSSVGKTDRVALSLPLRHGSVVVQEGRALQECFEHAVLPTWDARSGGREGGGGGGRFGVTARSIGVQEGGGGDGVMLGVKKEEGDEMPGVL